MQNFVKYTNEYGDLRYSRRQTEEINNQQEIGEDIEQDLSESDSDSASEEQEEEAENKQKAHKGMGTNNRRRNVEIFCSADCYGDGLSFMYKGLLVKRISNSFDCGYYP